MFHTEDMPSSDHPIHIDLVEQEKSYCQSELLRLYNHGTITEKDIALRFAELKKLLKIMYDNICELHNLVDGINRK